MSFLTRRAVEALQQFQDQQSGLVERVIVHDKRGNEVAQLRESTLYDIIQLPEGSATWTKQQWDEYDEKQLRAALACVQQETKYP